MRNSPTYPWLPLLLVLCLGCENEGPPPYDTDFPIPRTVTFAESLSAYDLFEPPLNNLNPQSGVFVYELASELFTDYAAKQRLLKLPAGKTVQVDNEWNLTYPEGTILAKTFSYPTDFRDPSKGQVLIETRLLILASGQWNMAAYRWNEEQTDALLMLDGDTVRVSWIDEEGRERSTEYGVPHEGECVTCHQREGRTRFIGPTIENLNTLVFHGEEMVDQLNHFTQEGLLEGMDWDEAPQLAESMNANESVESRARAYLNINCAHCHQPGAWDASADEGLDFRFDTPLEASGIQQNQRQIMRLFESGGMPYLGTTLIHEEGVELLNSFLGAL